jgi:hypothetical protein
MNDHITCYLVIQFCAVKRGRQCQDVDNIVSIDIAVKIITTGLTNHINVKVVCSFKKNSNVVWRYVKCPAIGEINDLWQRCSINIPQGDLVQYGFQLSRTEKFCKISRKGCEKRAVCNDWSVTRLNTNTKAWIGANCMWTDAACRFYTSKTNRWHTAKYDCQSKRIWPFGYLLTSSEYFPAAKCGIILFVGQYLKMAWRLFCTLHSKSCNAHAILTCWRLSVAVTDPQRGHDKSLLDH